MLFAFLAKRLAHFMLRGVLRKLSGRNVAQCLCLQVEGKAVFVTGCDSGFGHALAKHLHKLGFTVFAGCLLKVMW